MSAARRKISDIKNEPNTELTDPLGLKHCHLEHPRSVRVLKVEKENYT